MPVFMAADTLQLNATQTLAIQRSTPDVLELVSTWDVGGKPPPIHWHPEQHERFEVLDGELTVEVGSDAPRVLGVGDVIEVPPPTGHRMWNAGSTTTVRAAWSITPAKRSEQMFRYIDRGMGGLRGIVMLMKFRHEFRLGRGPS